MFKAEAGRNLNASAQRVFTHIYEHEKSKNNTRGSRTGQDRTGQDSTYANKQVL